MSIVDFTHTIETGMSCYCDEERVNITTVGDIDRDGYECKALNVFTHTGTHIDSPRHMSKRGRYIDEYSLEELTGRGLIINLNGKGNIEKEELIPFESEMRKADFILINTSWSKYWNSEKYLKDYRVLSKGGAEYLASFKIKGIGVDCISIGKGDGEKESHEMFLNSEILILENLKLTDDVKGVFQLFIAPLKIKNSDGAPVRVFGIID